MGNSHYSRSVTVPRTADGKQFRFRAGRWSLDLCSTLLWRHLAPVELLREPADLDRWFVAANLSCGDAEATCAELDDAHALRESAFRLFQGRIAGEELHAADVVVMNRLAARVGRFPQLTRLGGVQWSARAPVEAGLAAVAGDCIELLGGPLSGRLRACAAPDCAFLFVDTSRPGTRLWCAEARCGNRQRVREHRKRQGHQR
ncbi:CGNR zinc finger domain-containing protein [Pseudonocardia sp. TRM90224]|uniref:CGNR zinc finger domain-containing protein n=1 Tax=Pseudonocardia sp. TRM90224 TaxID=2812678 RepID=UPI0035A82C32